MRGDSYDSDIAVDDISLGAGPCLQDGEANEAVANSTRQQTKNASK
jgi:hypothetical protein